MPKASHASFVAQACHPEASACQQLQDSVWTAVSHRWLLKTHVCKIAVPAQQLQPQQEEMSSDAAAGVDGVLEELMIAMSIGPALGMMCSFRVGSVYLHLDVYSSGRGNLALKLRDTQSTTSERCRCFVVFLKTGLCNCTGSSFGVCAEHCLPDAEHCLPDTE